MHRLSKLWQDWRTACYQLCFESAIEIARIKFVWTLRKFSYIISHGENIWNWNSDKHEIFIPHMKCKMSLNEACISSTEWKIHIWKLISLMKLSYYIWYGIETLSCLKFYFHMWNGMWNVYRGRIFLWQFEVISLDNRRAGRGFSGRGLGRVSPTWWL